MGAGTGTVTKCGGDPHIDFWKSSIQPVRYIGTRFLYTETGLSLPVKPRLGNNDKNKNNDNLGIVCSVSYPDTDKCEAPGCSGTETVQDGVEAYT